MAKKVVATLRNTSGVKYAKLIRSKKSDKTGAYQFKEEIVIEDHVKECRKNIPWAGENKAVVTKIIKIFKKIS